MTGELLRHLKAAAEATDTRTIIGSGGVACNQGLRRAALAAHLPARVLFPSPGLSTDNAAMIGAAAFPKFERGEFSGYSLAAKANLPLA